MGNSVENEVKTLQVASADQVRNELALTNTQSMPAVAEPTLEQKADSLVDSLLATPVESDGAKKSARTSVETLASDTASNAARMSEMLKQPIGNLSKRGSEGGDVANSLMNLKNKVEELDPAKFNFESGWLSRSLGFLPGVGQPLKKYFTKYESGQTVIKSIISSLEKGRDQLQRDNMTMGDDQKEMRTATVKLQRAVQLGQLIDQRLEAKLTTLTDENKKNFVQEELLFPLRQRIIDLQQQLAVNQQGVLAMELIIRNNSELVRGVNRALNVTISALQVGVAVAVALENQKNVLEKVNAVSSTTSDLIASTAARLKTQGAEIQKQASSTTLNMESLKAAFADINSAIDDVSNFRKNALPQMAQSVLELDKLTSSAGKTIQSVEAANRNRPQIRIDVD